MNRQTALMFALILLLAKLLPLKAENVPPLPPVVEANDRMGTCFSYYPDGNTRARQAYEAGSRWDRFDFRWDAIQRSSDSFDASGHHNIVDNIDLPNQLNVVGILWATPDWAACSNVVTRQTIMRFQSQLTPNAPGRQVTTADPGSRVPCGLELPWNDAGNRWGQYVYRLVSEFKDTVHVWELWNEADRPWFWAGTEAQYAQILKVGYQAVKAADPEATVLFGGLAYWGNTGFYSRTINHLLATDPTTLANHGYFDVMSLHLYSDARTNYDISREVMQEVQASVGWHPLWLTEAGVPIWDEKTTPPQDFEATAEEAANYVIQGYAEARAAGVDKFFFFRLHDEEMNGQFFGLTRNDYTLRPAYVAYQVVARYLRGENQVTGPWRGETERITFFGTPYGRIDVLWNTTGAPITYTHPAILPTATLVNKRGVTQTLTAQDGVYTLTLPAATSSYYPPDGAYIIGGAPVLLLQTDVEPPTSALHPLSPQFYTNSLPLSWDASDTLSGYWYAEIQRASTPTGPWQLAAGWGQTNSVTQTTVPLPYDPSRCQSWYFRMRARDQAGNWEPWPDAPETRSDFGVCRPVVLTVSLESEPPQTFLAPYPPATLRWLTTDGSVVSQTIGYFTTFDEGASFVLQTPWVVSAAVYPGPYYLHITQVDHLSVMAPFSVLPGEGAQSITLAYKLHLVHARLYLPAILRNH